MKENIIKNQLLNTDLQEILKLLVSIIKTSKAQK